MKKALLILIFVGFIGCIPITVNLYLNFDREVESALDDFERDIRQPEKEKPSTPSPNKKDSGSFLNHDSTYLCFCLFQDDKKKDDEKGIKIDKNNKKIKKIIESKGKRFKKLVPYYEDGKIGEGNDAELKIRDTEGLDDKEKEELEKLVEEENKDRADFIKEVAKDNKIEDEKLDRIKKIYAKVLRKKAEVGWWIQDDPDEKAKDNKDKEGKWRKKTKEDKEKEEKEEKKEKEKK